MVLMQALIQYFILIALLVAGFLLITSISLQDWMREEMSVKIPNEMLDVYKNQTTSLLPPDSANRQKLNQYFAILESGDMSVDMKAHCALQQTCFMVTIKGYENPIKLAIPELKWCLKNDFFTKPQTYGVPSGVSMEYFNDQAKALQNARVCMILAILCVALAVLVLLVKLCKWQKESVFATVILVLISCICVVAALGVVNSNFKFKKDFDKMKHSLTSVNQNYGGYGGRRRRDDDNPGYSGMYPSVTSGSYQQQMAQAQIMQMVMAVIPTLELKESIGSPLVMAGLGVGLLLLVIILNGAEFYLLRKHGCIEAKYHNVELS